MDTPPCVDIQFYVVVRDHDEIFHIGRNECLEIIAILKFICVTEEKYCRRYSLSREDNLSLKSDNYAMKIFNLFSVLEFQVG